MPCSNPSGDEHGGDSSPTNSEYDYTRTGSSELGRELSLQQPTGLPRQIGPYRILEKIGEGGMGAVCLAEQTEPIKRRVALKLIKGGAHSSSEIVARFEAERQALAMMDHPNIAKILDGGQTEDGTPYFVMELVDGVPLTEYCDREKLTIRERLQLFLPVCRAVHHAHQKGIIHRDLKPSNVLVAIHDDQPVPKVIDFGLAKAVDRKNVLGDSSLETEFGQLLGTIRYMSPEQADLGRLDVDTRTDIYSLGVMLYELLTGTTPLDQDTLQKEAKLRILELIRERDPPRPSARLQSDQDSAISASHSRKVGVGKLQSLLRGELDWIAMRALELEPSRRYETANSFGEDVLRFLEGRAVLARPPSTLYRLQKLARQHRAAAATIAIILVSLTTATVVSVNYAFESHRQKVLAKKAQDKAEAQEKEAQTAAEREKRERQAQEIVTQIMLQVFDAGDPILGRLLSKYGSEFGEATSIQSVVKQVALEELEDRTKLADFPKVRARLLNALGDICLSSGDVQLSKRVFEKSAALLSQAGVSSGADHNKTVMAHGAIDYLLGDLKASKTRLNKFLEECDIDSLEQQYRTEAIRDKAFGTFVLAGVYMEEEDFDTTFKLLEQVSDAEVGEARDLPVLFDFARILTALVTMYEMDVKDEFSVQRASEILNAMLAGIGKLNVQNTLVSPFRGVVWAEIKGLVGISPYGSYVKMHERLAEATGENHFLTLLSRYGMAVSAERFNDYDNSARHYQKIIELADETLGRGHPRFALVLQRYANLEFNQWLRTGRKSNDKLQSAIDACREALEIREARLGQHRITATSLYWLGRMEFEAKGFTEAQRHFDNALEIRREVYGRHRHVSRVLMWKAEAEVESKQFEKAIATSDAMIELDQELKDSKKLERSSVGSNQLVAARIRIRADKADVVPLELVETKQLLEMAIENMESKSRK